MSNTNRNKRKSPPENIAAQRSYNHWVEQLSAAPTTPNTTANNNDDNNESTTAAVSTAAPPPRFPPPSHHRHHLPSNNNGGILTQSHRGGIIITQQQQQYRGMAVQQYPPPMLLNTTTTKTAAVNNNTNQHFMGVAGYAHRPTNLPQDPSVAGGVVGVGGVVATAPSNNTNTATHPSLSYLSITTNQNHQNNNHLNNTTAKHAPPPPPHLHHHRNINPHSNPFTTAQAQAQQQYAATLQALNALNNAAAMATANNGVLLRSVGGGVGTSNSSNIGYNVNHANYLSLGGNGNGLSAVVRGTSGGVRGTSGGRAGGAGVGVGGLPNRQHIPHPSQQQAQLQQLQQQQQVQHAQHQQQQAQHLFTTGTTLPNYNSTIPTSTGLTSIHSSKVLSNITRRVLNECTCLCLLPNEQFLVDAANSKRRRMKKKKEKGGRFISSTTNQWLRSTVTLVYSLLNLESPNPVGWNDNGNDNYEDSAAAAAAAAAPIVRNVDNTNGTTTAATTSPAQQHQQQHWIKGTQHKLQGPQPWQCTRPFISKAVYQLLSAEGYTDWFISDYRWGELEGMVRSVIVRSLIAWKPSVFGKEGNGGGGSGSGSDGVLVERYSKLIWGRFRTEKLRTIVDCEEALVPPQISFSYICHVASGCSDWASILEEEKKRLLGEVVDLVSDDNGGDGEEEKEDNDDGRDPPSTSLEVSPDDAVEIPICLPVGHDGGADFSWESKWNCDYCSASFSNYDQAKVHETECKAKSDVLEAEAEAAKDDETKAAAAKESAEMVQNNDDDGGGDAVENNQVEYVIEEKWKWKCDHCTESFPMYNEAVAHENVCKAKSHAAEAAIDGDESKAAKEVSETVQNDDDGGNAAGNNVEYAIEQKWECDHCPASFATYDEALAHENECQAKSQAVEAAIGDGSKSKETPDTVQNDGGNSVENIVDYTLEEKWKCEHCPASFSSYDEAVAHENKCKAKSLTVDAAKDDDSKSEESPDTKESYGGDVRHENECQAQSQTIEAAIDDESKSREYPETKDSNDGDVTHQNECKAKSQAVDGAKNDDSKSKEGLGTNQSNDGDGTHANECQAQSQAAEAAKDDENKTKTSPETNENDDGNADVNAVSNVEDAIEEKWKCDYCSASFSLYDEAVAHENECKSKSQEVLEKKVDEMVIVTETDEAANQSSVEGGEGFILEEIWKCDYCPASYHVFDDAVLHESKCKAKLQSTAAADGTTDVEFQTSDECGEKRVDDDAVEEQWQCDFCGARFNDFDEAATHEAECKRLSEAATSLPEISSTQEKDVEKSPQHFDVGSGTEFFTSNELRSSVLHTLELLHYEYFPLMSGGVEKLGEVCEKVLRCMHSVTPVTKGYDAISKREVERVLNHLEHQSGYLTTLNGIFRVRVNTTALMEDSTPESPAKDSTPESPAKDSTPESPAKDSIPESPAKDSTPESPAETVRSMSWEPEDTEEVVVTYGLNSDGDQVIMAASSPEGVAAKSRMPQSIVTDITDRLTPCGECILCNAPDCERCSVCLSKGQTESDICIRKSCCKIPFEDKAKSLVGFPPNWQYAFCDPNQGIFAKAPRQILSLAGLVMRRPLSAASPTTMHQYFHSFEAAFSAVQLEDIKEATKLVETFLSHVHGSDAMKSYPDHFLVGRRFCFEFTNINGMNVAMFGVISTCFRERSEAETDIFMIQYDLDCIEIALKSLGTNIPRLQLISSEQAWGGCISFERKARIHGRHSIVRSIDQATAVEYWVTPDMRLEEMVEQEDGIKVPMLTILLRGYKFVFSAHNDDEGIAVSVSCTSMNVGNGNCNNEKSILKPGELIDLGVFCPLIDSDIKPLPVFVLKNYIHSFSIDSCAGDGNGYVYDLTDDRNGMIHIAAKIKVLSYVRSCNASEVPTIHGGLDPSGKVHLLYGVRYRGDWEEYSSIMEAEIQPVFRGEQREVTLARNLMMNEHQEWRYLSAMKYFGPEDILQCAEFIGSLFLGSPTVVKSIRMRERTLSAANCLRHRISELGDPRLNIADQLIQHAFDLVQASRQQYNNNNNKL